MDIHGNRCILFVVFLLVRFGLAINPKWLIKVGLVNPKGGNCGTRAKEIYNWQIHHLVFNCFSSNVFLLPLHQLGPHEGSGLRLLLSLDFGWWRWRRSLILDEQVLIKMASFYSLPFFFVTECLMH